MLVGLLVTQMTPSSLAFVYSSRTFSRSGYTEWNEIGRWW